MKFMLLFAQSGFALIAIVSITCALEVHADDTMPGEAGLCQAVLDLANRGELERAFVPLMDPGSYDTDDWSAFESRTEEAVVGAYEFDLSELPQQRLLLVRQGGTCDSTGLRVPDESTLSIDERWIEEGSDYGVHTAMARINGRLVAVAYRSDRWYFTPLALAHWKHNRLTPLCAFVETDAVKRSQVSVPAHPICTALRAGRVLGADWKAVADNEIPESPAGTVIASAASRADLDWTGSGTKRPTWLLSYHSSASCGMTYNWIALDDSDAAHSALDDRSKLGRALFVATPGKYWQRRPWIIDSVFTYRGRAWLAGQPQDVGVQRNNYAIYGFDRSGAHVQCRYRHLPQYEIEHRGFGQDRRPPD